MSNDYKEVKEAFDSSQERKYKEWKKLRESIIKNPDTGEFTSDNRTPEQKAFDAYALDELDFIKKVSAKPQTLAEVKAWATDTTTGLGSYSLYGFSHVKKYDVAVLFGQLSDNGNKGFAVYVEVIENTGSTLRFRPLGYVTAIKQEGGGTETSFVVGNTTASSIDSGEQPVVDVELQDVPTVGGKTKKFTFDFKIPKGEQGPAGPQGPAGSGGGGATPIQPVKNKDYSTINGDFGLNLFDYRELSRDLNFKVNGKVLYIDNPKLISKADAQLKKLPVYNRLREDVNGKPDAITVKARLLESSDPFHDKGKGNNKLHAKVWWKHLNGEYEQTPLINTEFSNDTTSEEDKIPKFNKQVNHASNYSYLAIDMGGEDVPAKGKIEFTAYYGGIEPQGLEQKFEFKEYNGFYLKKNDNGVADSYVHSRWFDKLNMRLGMFNLKDAELVSVSEGDTSSTIIIKAPKDLWLPESYFSEIPKPLESAKVDKNIMSSNLCDIDQDNENNQRQNKPFLLRKVYQEDVYNKKLKIVEPVNVIYILMAKEDRHKWREHLSETQILYPICDPEKEITVQLPLGGYKFTLNSGDIIETNKYSKIEVFKNSSYKLTGSPFGYTDVIINPNNIASITTNIVPDKSFGQ